MPVQTVAKTIIEYPQHTSANRAHNYYVKRRCLSIMVALTTMKMAYLVRYFPLLLIISTDLSDILKHCLMRAEITKYLLWVGRCASTALSESYLGIETCQKFQVVTKCETETLVSFLIGHPCWLRLRSIF